MKIVYLTAGAAGMYCGSCMHDNTLARALIARGHDVQLLPLYTPIRTDEEDVTVDQQQFFGGINVFLQQKWSLFRNLPRWMQRAFDQRWLLQLAMRLGMKTDAHDLGALTVSMLQGSHGHQRQEALRLAEWLSKDARPDVINLSNILIAGPAPEIKDRVKTPIVVTLQGDDIFLRDLPAPYEEQALAEIRRLEPHLDGFIVNSRYYAEEMSAYLGLPREKFHVQPLGIDTRDFERLPAGTPDERPLTIGYLARLAPEKGLHVLADAFRLLKARPGMEQIRLKIAGWLGKHRQEYAEQTLGQLGEAGFGDAVEYVGEVDRAGKVRFLQSIDVLSVPTTYREPKGLFVLEALACGVPCVQPAHGAFPELIDDLGGGLLFPPGDPAALADALEELLLDSERRRQLGQQGREAVLTRRNAAAMAENMERLLDRLIRGKGLGQRTTSARSAD